MDLIRVLVVDDEQDFLESLVSRLKRRKIDPTGCPNGEEALETMKVKPFDIVVLDVRMPGMDGIEVLRRIREQYPGTEVIMLTGHASVRTGIEGIKLGAFDYLLKPIDLDQLVVKVRQAYEKIVREEEEKREAEFKAKQEQQMIATERLASLGTLAVGMAHEINNPLQIMKSEYFLMKMITSELKEKSGFKEFEDLQELEDSLAHVSLEIDRCAKITQAILAFGKQSETSARDIDLKQFISKVVQGISKKLREQRIFIEEEVQENTPSIYGDPGLFERALLNLVNNAADAISARYGSRGGKILVAAGAENRDGVRIEIRDNGCGIAPEDLKKVFSPFFTTKPVGKGTGLGLSVCHGIVQTMNGRLSVTSEIGAGTTIAVSLPSAP